MEIVVIAFLWCMGGIGMLATTPDKKEKSNKLENLLIFIFWPFFILAGVCLALIDKIKSFFA